MLDSREKVYSIGNEPDERLSIARSLIYQLEEDEKCCYKVRYTDLLNFKSIGAPLLNERGEVLGLCNVKKYTGEAVPILTILAEFQENLGIEVME